MLEKHSTHREQVIKMFHSSFQERKIESYQISVNEKYVLVLSLNMYYDNMTTVVY